MSANAGMETGSCMTQDAPRRRPAISAPIYWAFPITYMVCHKLGSFLCCMFTANDFNEVAIGVYGWSLANVYYTPTIVLLTHQIKVYAVIY